MENTLQNKEKFFALYFGQQVMKHRDMDKMFHVNRSNLDFDFTNCYLELKAEIEESDWDDLICINGYHITGIEKDDETINVSTYGIDYLRSKGYALSYLDLSVDEQIEYGWVKLKESSNNSKMYQDEQEIKKSISALQEIIFNQNKACGWHEHKDGTPYTQEEQEAKFPERIALCHSELSEALGGWRQDLKDDHLPHRINAEVELADTVIRTLELARIMNYNIADAIFEKMAYNRDRADHKRENRQKENGKRI